MPKAAEETKSNSKRRGQSGEAPSMNVMKQGDMADWDDDEHDDPTTMPEIKALYPQVNYESSELVYAGGKLLRDPKDLLPLNESTPYTLTIRFQLGEAAKGSFKGTFLAQAPSEKSKTGKSLGRGIWKNGGDVQGKLFAFRGGRPFFDIGWVGYISANVDICSDGNAHTISYRFDGAHYHIWVDGREVADTFRSEAFSSGNAKTEDDPQEQEILVASGVGTLMDKNGLGSDDLLFDQKSAKVEPGMSPPLKHKSAIKWIVFDTESERGPSPAGSSLGGTPEHSTGGPTPAESKLKHGVISWVREGKSVPYLVVTPHFGADMSASDYAKEILETVGRAGGGEDLSLPPLIFNVNKVTDTDCCYNPKNPLSDSFALDPVDGLDMDTVLYKLLGKAEPGGEPDQSKSLIEDGRACLTELESMLDEIANSAMLKPIVTKQEQDANIHKRVMIAKHIIEVIGYCDRWKNAASVYGGDEEGEHKSDARDEHWNIDPDERTRLLMKSNQVLVHSQQVLQGKLTDIIKSVMRTCAESGAWVMPDHSMLDNNLCTQVCEAAPDDVLTLGINTRYVGGYDNTWDESLFYRESMSWSYIFDQLEAEAKGLDEDVVPVELDTNEINEISKRERVRRLLPSPSVKKMILFTCRAQEAKYKRGMDELDVPVGAFLINGTPKALERLLRSIKKNKPVFVFKHTGGATRAATFLIEQAKKVAEHNPGLPIRFTLPDLHPHSDERKKFFPQGLDAAENAALQYIKDHKLEDKGYVIGETRLTKAQLRQGFVKLGECPHVETRTRRLAETWPENWKPESALVIDALTVSTEQLTDSLTGVMSSAFETVPELGGRKAEVQVIKYAWKLRDTLDTNAARLSRTASIMYNAITVTTLSAIVLTTWYSQSDDDFQDSTEGDIVNFIAMVLPLLTAALVAIMANAAPVSKWATCKLSAALVESEIYRYRCQVGDYKPRSSSSRRKGARAAFTENLQAIWQEIMTSDLKGGALVRLNDIPTTDESDEPDFAVDVPPPANDDGAAVNGVQITNQVNAGAGGQLAPVASAIEADVENQTNQTNQGREARGTNSCCRPCVSRLTRSSQEEGDSKFGKLSAEGYIKYRLKPVLQQKQRITPTTHRWLSMMTNTNIILTSMGTLLVATGLSAWVPVLLGVTAAISMTLHHTQLETKLMGSNAAIAQLNQLLLWWRGLTLIEKRNNANKLHLVDATEAAVSAELNAYVSAAVSASKPKEDEDEDGENEGDGGSKKSK